MTHILLRGEVGKEITAIKVAAILDQCHGEIVVVVDSNGGSVADGIAIFNQLRQYNNAKAVVTTIAQQASSAASIVWLAGDQRMVARGGEVLIHSSHGGGDAMTKAANDWMLEIYAHYCNQPNQIKAVLASGEDFIWTPEAAVEWGLAHIAMHFNVEDRYDFACH